MPYTLFDLLFQPKLNPAYGASEPSHVSDTFTGDPTEAMKKYGTTNIYQQPSFFQKLVAPQISGEIMAANREASLEPIKQASQLSYADRLQRQAHDFQRSVLPDDARLNNELELERLKTVQPVIDANSLSYADRLQRQAHDYLRSVLPKDYEQDTTLMLGRDTAQHEQLLAQGREQAKTYLAATTGVSRDSISNEMADGYVAMYGAKTPVNPKTVGETQREQRNLRGNYYTKLSQTDVNAADYTLGELERGKAIQGKRKSLLDTELEAMGGEMAQRWQSAFNPMWASQGASVLPKVPMFDKLSGELQNTDNPSYQSPMARQLQQAQELQGTQAGAPVVKPSNGPAVRLKPKAKKSGLGAPYKVVGEAVGDDATVEEPVKKPTTPVPQAVKKTPTPTTPANTVKLRLKNGQVIDLPVAQTADLGDIPWKKAGVTMLDYLDALLTNKPLPAYR